MFKWCKFNNPKILISGINPHAGEKGGISNDENKILIPEINRIKEQNIDIKGPISADAMLTQENIKVEEGNKIKVDINQSKILYFDKNEQRI